MSDSTEQNIPGVEEEDQPGENGERGKEELSRNRHEQGKHQQHCRACLHQRSGGLADGEGKDGKNDQY